MKPTTKTWPKVNGLYQIYPRSFKDSDGDGVGDLKGIISKLDYLNGSPDSLGIEAIWISPIYPSPMADFGYDVSDYCDIDPQFGTIEDFKVLLDEAHQRGIKVMLDYVPNHTSDQHRWFQEAASSRDSIYRDYYVWSDPAPDGGVPNNWLSIFGGSMWEWHEPTQQYYLHSFLKEQPDLNWDNPLVRQDMKGVLRFWMDLGVDGFRADAVWHMSKDPDMRDNPIDPRSDGGEEDFWAYIHRNSKYGPRLHEYLGELTEVIEEYPDRFIVFENYPDANLGDVVAQYRSFYDINPRVGAPFNFEGMHLEWGAQNYGRFLKDFNDMLRPGDMPVFCFANHDQMRIVTRFGREHARLIALMQLTLPGLPTIYYGDEIGMENGVILPEQIQDPSGRDNPMGGRDPERTPMQWDDSLQAGFTSGQPWLPVAKSYMKYNVANETNDPDSFLSVYRKLLRLRRDHEVFVSGNYVPIQSHEDVLAYERNFGDDSYVVALNFSDKPRDVFMSYTGKIICTTHPADMPELRVNGELVLRAYEGVLVKV